MYKVIISGVADQIQEVECATLEEAESCKAYFDVQSFVKSVRIEVDGSSNEEQEEYEWLEDNE